MISDRHWSMHITNDSCTSQWRNQRGSTRNETVHILDRKLIPFLLRSPYTAHRQSFTDWVSNFFVHSPTISRTLSHLLTRSEFETETNYRQSGIADSNLTSSCTLEFADPSILILTRIIAGSVVPRNLRKLSYNNMAILMANSAIPRFRSG